MRHIYIFLSSLRLTVALLLLSLFLVFFGTLDQVNFGIYEVQKCYFESFLAIWHYPPQWPFFNKLDWILLPMPGGYLLGGLLVTNLLFAHFRYFSLQKKKIGIAIIHTGLVLLIISGFLSSALQEESQMWIQVGSRNQYAESQNENELVIIDTSDTNHDHVVSIPLKLLQRNLNEGITHPSLPFRIQVIAYYPNAEIGMLSQNPDIKIPNLATQGAGFKMGLFAMPRPVTYKENEINTATAYIQLIDGQEDIGTWLVSNLIDDRFPPQKFEWDGHTYKIALRFKRTYFPFSLYLKEFKHEIYPGTQIPKNFSSLLEIENPGLKENRSALIYMNHPLRYGGYTFYQAAFANQDTTSILEVVKNPSYRLPYFSVAIISLGLLIQFLMHLVIFLRKRSLHT